MKGGFDAGFDAGYSVADGAQITRLWPYGGPGHPYGSFAGKVEQVVVVPEIVESSGGFLHAYARTRDEEEVRQERIARGIIPAGEPEVEAIIEASKQPVALLARRRLKERVEASRQAELEALLDRVLEAQREAREAYFDQLIADLQQVSVEAESFNRNQNASAVLVMLGAL